MVMKQWKFRARPPQAQSRPRQPWRPRLADPAYTGYSNKSPEDNCSIHAFAAFPVLAIAGAITVILILTSSRYGYFGDELYFVAAGNHLAWGYADQPPLLPLLARGIDSLFPGSVVALRLPAALLTGVGVVLTAMTARELGGRRRAQLLSAAAYPTSTQSLATGHLFATSTVDPILWMLIICLIVRWIRTRNDWLLLWAGLVTAADMQVKYLIPAFWLCVGVSVLVLGPRDLLLRPLLWIGGLLAMAAAVPSLLWQGQHGWPILGMSRVVADEVAQQGGRLFILPDIVVHAGIAVGAILFIYGILRLLRSHELRPYRFLGTAAVGVVAVVVIISGRFYYTAGLYPLGWAVGAVGIQQRTPGFWWRWAVRWPSYALSIIVALPFSLPIFAPDPTNIVSGGSVGWATVVDAVSRAYDSLSLPSRANTVVVTEMYWQASAVDVLGRQRGLPPAYSGNRGYWYFGPPPESSDTLLYIGSNVGRILSVCNDPRKISVITNPGGFRHMNDEISIWICKRRGHSWSAVWPLLRQLE
jgi:hypothetical protein